ncbi:ABC transporter ATP-binding protein [Roseomonas sp. CCTCC AB2023176]|uniref:ABC transporter ATP-binding protein n=1 Tax=Roseomonas sp. CCTCC AB2023176 TaxID=3342640 RepID=UPI0035DCF256
MMATDREAAQPRNVNRSPEYAPLLQVEGLRKHFTVTRGFPKRETVTVRAVDGVSFSIAPGEALGLVGESGCGKSTAARALLRLIEPDAGRVLYRGQDVTAARGGDLRALRQRMQIVFQDPYSSLDPRQTIGSALIEPLRLHGIARGPAARDRAAALLEEVGLPPSALDRFPHEFSGGQRQRIGIARALTVEPELIVADEPVSALDVSVQAQVLLLLRDLQRRRGLSFLFVSHDLSVVRWFCDRVAVMYLGRIIEEGPVDRVLRDPLHPYARVLRDASPVPDPALRGALPRLTGELPSAASPPRGCHFHPRCPRALPVCATAYPGWTATGQGGVACHLHGPGTPAA